MRGGISFESILPLGSGRGARETRSSYIHLTPFSHQLRVVIIVSIALNVSQRLQLSCEPRLRRIFFQGESIIEVRIYTALITRKA